MSLTEAQSKHLRGLGHALKPIVFISTSGLTDAVLAELDGALAHHELVKVRIRVGDRKERDALLEQLVEQTEAHLIQRIGNVALLYREAEEPKIKLPQS